MSRDVVGVVALFAVLGLFAVIAVMLRQMARALKEARDPRKEETEVLPMRPSEALVEPPNGPGEVYRYAVGILWTACLLWTLFLSYDLFIGFKEVPKDMEGLALVIKSSIRLAEAALPAIGLACLERAIALFKGWS